MRRSPLRVLSRACLVIAALLALPVAAQEPQRSVAQQRYGAPLGLPRDGAELYLPDQAYPRWPLPPGEENTAMSTGRR